MQERTITFVDGFTMRDILTTFLETAHSSFALRGPVVQVGGGHDYCLKRLTAGDEYLLCRFETAAERVRLPVPDAAARLALLIDPDGPVTMDDSASESSLHLASRKQSCMRQLLAELIRTTQPGGAILIALRTEPKPAGRRRPIDESIGWIPTPALLQNWFAGLAVSLVGWQGEALRPRYLFGIGMKSPAPLTIAQSVSGFLDRIEDRAADHVGWLSRWRRFAKHAWSKIRGEQPVDPDQLSWLAHYAKSQGTPPPDPHIGLTTGNRRTQDSV